MQAREKFWVAAALVLAGVYVALFTDWFRAGTIQVLAATRPVGNPDPGAAYPVTFTFSDSPRLTRIKVSRLVGVSPARSTHPAWQLVLVSNAAPLPGLVYGTPPAGMRPEPAGSAAAALEPGATYRIEVEAGRSRGSLDFRATGPEGPVP